MAEFKRKQLLTTSRPPSSSSEDDDTPAFHLQYPSCTDKTFREFMEKNGYLDQKEEEGEEAKGATHGNDEEEFDFEKWKNEQLEEIRRLEEKPFHESDWELIREMEQRMVDRAKPAIELRCAEMLGEVSAKQTTPDT